MKTKLIVLLSATTLSCLALSVRADHLGGNDITSQRDQDEAHARRLERLGDLEKANKIIGMEIKDDQGQKIGKVKDLALDLPNGRIVEVIVATGGVLGIDEKLIAVPASSFTCDDSKKVLRLNVDKAQLKSAPEFKMSNWSEATDGAQVREVYQRYGVEPYFVHDQQPIVAGVNTVNPDAQDKRGQASTYYSFPNQTTNIYIYRNATPIQLGTVTRATRLLGTTAVNLQNEKLGKVHNFLVDLHSGRVAEVIIASGGFLGMRDELSAIPPQAFRWNADNTELTLDTTKEFLKSAPHFKASEWSYVNEPASVTQVYSVYRVEPYFTTIQADGANQVDTSKPADNTAQNVRDRSGNTVTPTDQSNNKSDRQTTAQIRKAIVGDSNMSTNAKNVKIITVNGQVTLRGVVNSEEEKRMVADIASRTVSTDKLDNQLEVRTAPEAK